MTIERGSKVPTKDTYVNLVCATVNAKDSQVALYHAFDLSFVHLFNHINSFFYNYLNSYKWDPSPSEGCASIRPSLNARPRRRSRSRCRSGERCLHRWTMEGACGMIAAWAMASLHA